MGGADDSVKMSTSPTLLLDTRSAVHSTPVAAAEVTTAAGVADMVAMDDTAPPDTAAADADAASIDTAADSANTATASTATASTTSTTVTATSPATVVAVPAGDWSNDEETAAAVAGMEDVTAELSAPVVVVAGLGHTQWQLLAAAGAGVALFLLLALVLAYRRTGGRGSPALHKVIQHDDAECPPLLDYAPRPLDFAKYLGNILFFYGSI